MPAANRALWPVLERDSTAAMLALGLDVNSIRPSAAELGLMNPIGIEANPIEIKKQAKNIEPHLCAGIAPPAPSPKPQKPIGSLTEPWVLVGYKLATPRADQLHRARAAQQAGTDRHARRTPTASSAVDSSVRRVVRDEHAYDISA